MVSRRRHIKSQLLHEERDRQLRQARNSGTTISARERWKIMTSCRNCGKPIDDYTTRSKSGHPTLCYECIQQGYKEADYR